MTTAAGGGADEKRLFDHVALWCHHHDAYVWTAWVWTAVIVNFATSGTPGFSWLSLVPWIPWTGVMLAMVGGRLHVDKFFDCAFCHERQPLDAPAQAERYRQTLINVHNKRRLIIIGVLVFLALIGLPLILTRLLGPGFGSVGLLPMWIMMLHLGWSGRKHGQLQPWCPICRRRDEDDDPIDVPAPTPPGARVEA